MSFFWVHEEWIGARDKQIAWTAKRFSDDLFVPRSYSFPKTPTPKDTNSVYLHCFHQSSFLKFSEKSYEFKLLLFTNTILDVNHRACDLSNWRTTLWLCSLEIESKIFAWFKEGNIIPLINKLMANVAIPSGNLHISCFTNNGAIVWVSQWWGWNKNHIWESISMSLQTRLPVQIFLSPSLF